MKWMNFTKMQSGGNDYVVIETSDMEYGWSQAAITMCDRHFGVGADSLLLVVPSDKADLQMHIFDADGSEAEACGNGIRCLARYACEKGIISAEADRVIVETIVGIREVKLQRSGNKLEEIQANMGEPKFAAEEIPVTIKHDESKIVNIKSMLSYPVSIGGTDLILNFVSMGNPHAVYFSERPVVDFPMSRIGPKIERLKIFPNRTNFEVARVLNRGQIEARVWERGVGETLACGSGACAITAAAQLYGYIDKKVDIILPGDTLQVERNGTGEMLLSGPAEIVFEGKWPD
jgi:diaminopimelate epimerase